MQKSFNTKCISISFSFLTKFNLLLIYILQPQRISIRCYKMGRLYETFAHQKRAVGSVHIVGLEFIPIDKKTTHHKRAVGSVHIVGLEFVKINKIRCTFGISLSKI